MAFMSQEKKATIAPAVKAILKKYGMKGSLSINNHSTLVLTLKSGKLDLIANFNQTAKPATPVTDSIQVNEYWLDSHYSGRVLQFLQEIKTAMNVGNHDRSDIQSDYFDVGWYVNINVGKWNKPYILER
jgi:hypothetical protein